MAKARYLNLDELVGEVSKVMIKGIDYEIPEFHVGQFLKLLKVQQEAEKEQDDVKALDATREIIKATVPSLTDDVIDGLTIRQLQSLLEFIVSDVQDVAGAGKDEGQGNGKGLESKK